MNDMTHARAAYENVAAMTPTPRALNARQWQLMAIVGRTPAEERELCGIEALQEAAYAAEYGDEVTA